MPSRNPTPEWCQTSIFPSWANRRGPCGSAIDTATGRCWQYGHPRPPEEATVTDTTVTDTTGPSDPGAQDECATCGHRRWRHKEVDGQQVCTEYANCACSGHFVELSYGTRMARFVEAAQKLANAINATRNALGDAMHATGELYVAMEAAGLLPPDSDTPPTGKLAEAFDIPREFLPGTPGVQHWSAFSPAQQMPTPGTGQRVRSQDDLTGPVPDATEVIPAVQDPSPSALPAPGDRATLWSWDARNRAWVEIDSGTFEAMGQARYRRYVAGSRHDIPDAAWLVLAAGQKPGGDPDSLGVATT